VDQVTRGSGNQGIGISGEQGTRMNAEFGLGNAESEKEESGDRGTRS